MFQDPLPPFDGHPNFIKRENYLNACTQMCHVLVVTSYTVPHPFQNPVSAPVIYQFDITCNNFLIDPQRYFRDRNTHCNAIPG